MKTSLRRTAVAVAALALGSLGSLGPAGASAVAAPGSAAPAVTDLFSGVVNVMRPTGTATPGSGATRSTGPTGGSMVYTVTVKRVFAGTVDTGRVSVIATRGFSACDDSPLTRGDLYAFRLVRGQDDRLRATTCRSIRPATTAVLRQLERQHPDAHPPVTRQPAAPPRSADITPVSVSDPASFTRVAAPGLALVIVGLLGLLLVRRRRPS